jgi:hypothetical protein
VRTWEENKAAINQLWPTVKFTDEERNLWRDDLSGLDQSSLYDAIRNVKRTRDNPWPQLKWVLDEYREIARIRARASSPVSAKEKKLNITVDAEHDGKLAKDFCAYIDSAPPSEFSEIESKVLDKLPEMWSRTAVRVLKYARDRLLGETELFGRVSRDGSIQQISFTEVA